MEARLNYFITERKNTKLKQKDNQIIYTPVKPQTANKMSKQSINSIKLKSSNNSKYSTESDNTNFDKTKLQINTVYSKNIQIRKFK